MAGFGADLLGGLIAGKPKIPAFNPIDLGAEQLKAINANQTALAPAEKLAAGINTFNQDQIQSMLEKAIPGYNAIKGKVSGTVQDLLAGKIPKDVANLVQGSDASKAISGGYGGSGMHGNLVARDLGLTSLQLVDKGLSSAESWLATMDKIQSPGQFNVASMFISPEQYFTADSANRDMQFQHDYMSNLNDWQHSFNYFLGKDVEDTMNTTQSTILGMVGSLGGGMGGAAKPAAK